MASSLERVVYESRATDSTGSLLNLATILAQSQRNNARDGLTGALAAHREHFVQVLEGRADQLALALKRISADPRHGDIRILEQGPINARSFEGWSMAAARISPELAPRLEQILAARGTGSGPEIVSLLRSVSLSASA
ncbi:MAG: BLUF domain-containing protein [Brevundimonas sp.]|uniref:BLUF domain-containing protein n=1 Tax=Brevundimonas sp. TaxID=1871086 RepID=UPI0039191FAA